MEKILLDFFTTLHIYVGFMQERSKLLDKLLCI